MKLTRPSPYALIVAAALFIVTCLLGWAFLHAPKPKPGQVTTRVVVTGSPVPGRSTVTQVIVSPTVVPLPVPFVIRSGSPTPHATSPAPTRTPQPTRTPRPIPTPSRTPSPPPTCLVSVAGHCIR